MRTLLPLAILALIGAATSAPAQETRLNVFDPAVVLNTGGRTAACDALQFTPDGKTLLAVGDDKCVHTWDVTDRGLQYGKPAWWNSFRERRGSLYALDLTRDGQFAVAGGFGRLTADVVLFHLPTRTIRHALSPALNPAYQTGGTVWAVAFDPDHPRAAVGTDDGAVWVWDYEAKPSVAVRKVAPAVGGPDPLPARVVWVDFGPGGKVMFARRSGEVFETDPDKASIVRKLFAFDHGSVYQAVMTPDRTRVVARTDGQRLVQTPKGPRVESAVEVRGLPDGKRFGSITYPRSEFPDSLAVDPAGKRIGVGVRILDAAGGEKFFREAAGQLRIYDITGSEPKMVAEAGFGTGSNDPVTTYPEAIAFHPDGKRIAVAAGWDHETSLWAIEGTGLKPLDVSSGVGRVLWQVRASADGMKLSFRDKAQPIPLNPNERGAGPWRTFDLKTRTWLRSTEPEAGGPIETANGWKVETDPTDVGRWYVTDGTHRHAIPTDRLRDNAPICYTFLPPKPGDVSTRLAVGHYWGYSLFELRSDAPPRRTRRGTGHHGYVTSIVPANGGKWLITASRDETMCIWSTEPWGHHPELGATFDDVGAAEFQVKAVDPGSPAWEVGLIPGDKLRKVWRDGRAMEPIDWEATLTKPTPGEELAFEVWRFEGQKAPLLRKTALLQRPVWRFLPTAGKDWVLYRYQDYVYDAGGNGDSYLGWLLGGPSAADTPEFVPAERFRAQFCRPDEVAVFLTKNSREPSPFFKELLPPPKIEAKASADVVPAAGVTIDVTVTPPPAPGGGTRPVDKIELWLGDENNLDTLLREWPGGKDKLTLKATVKPEELRLGANRLVVVAHSQARAEKPVEVTVKAAEQRPGVLRGLVIGVNKYRQLGVRDLTASVDDAKLVSSVMTQIGRVKPFERSDVKTLLDEEATPAAILAELDRVAAEAAPDDWFVLFLAGHGFARRAGGSGPDSDGAFIPGSWFFAGYAPDKGTNYEVPAKEIFGKLKRAKCRKLILLDSCHSGAAMGADGGRDLRPEDKGPVVLAAAAPDEEAAEGFTTVVIDGKPVRARHGFFTASLSAGLGVDMAVADRNHDGVLTVDELFEYTRNAVARLRQDQTVQMIPFPLRNLGLVRAKN